MEHISSVITGKKQEKENKKGTGKILFKKGQSGNPNGRPKGARNLNTLFNDALEALADDPECTDTEREIFKNLMIKAKQGDIAAMKLYLEYRYGKPKHQEGDTLKIDLEEGFTAEEKEMMKQAIKNAGLQAVVKA